MSSPMRTSITLFGKAPWGFSLSGGKDLNQPLVVTKVNENTVAARSCLAPGDIIIAVNGESVAEMNATECETVINKATASLYLLLVKNGAKVVMKPNGDVSVEGDRDVYSEESSQLKRLAKYNRQAKPFSPASTQDTRSFAPLPNVNDWSKTKKPAGFRSVVFSPKETTKKSIN